MANITGTSRNDTLIGTGNTDTISGLEGNDILNGGAGIDTLIGGAGDDTYIVDTTTDTITEFGGGGTDTVQSSVSYILGQGSFLNNLTLTGASATDGTGNDYDNIIRGNSAGNILNGGAGIDTLIGGAGDDTYIVDTTTDTITELSGGGTDTVQSSVSYILGQGSFLNNLTLTGSSAINGTGNEYDNIITGNTGTNVLQGGAGNDVMDDGGDGNDTLLGGAGDDDIFGGDPFVSDNNYVTIYGGEGNDRLGSFFGDVYGESGNDLIDGVYSSLYGGSGNDNLWGEYGYVDGGSGNDQLRGNDATLVGGSGRDTLTGDILYSIRYNSSSEGGDTINGFDPGDGSSRGDGLIVIDASGFGGGLVAGALSSSQFILGSSAQDSNDRFIYNSTGNLFFDVDGNTSGGKGQVQLATLTGGVSLSASDFSIIA